MHATAEAIDALLPQTQCTRCGFDGCAPYAAAIARNGAPINRCPPGGTATIDALAALTGLPASPLDTSCGALGSNLRSTRTINTASVSIGATDQPVVSRLPIAVSTLAAP